MIMGEDLNFSMGIDESWGPKARLYPLSEIFSHILESKKMVNVEPLKIMVTWRNKRVGEERIAKILDHFSVAEQLVDSQL
jgi:hypothetical protein